MRALRLSLVLALAALFAARPARAQQAAADPDPWFGPDKALHAGASAVIAGGGYAVGALVWDDYAGPIALGSGLALGAGVAKESLDAAGLGDPSWRDLAWDVIGTAIGIGISVLVHAAVRAGDGASRAAPAR